MYFNVYPLTQVHDQATGTPEAATKAELRKNVSLTTGAKNAFSFMMQRAKDKKVDPEPAQEARESPETETVETAAKIDDKSEAFRDIKDCENEESSDKSDNIEYIWYDTLVAAL